MQSDYTIRKASNKCMSCKHDVDLLCREDGRLSMYWFYICWNCRSIFQLGKGPVSVHPERTTVVVKTA